MRRHVDSETAHILRSLVQTYASGVDRRDRDLFLSAFLPDATLAVYGVGETFPTSEMVSHDAIGKVTERIGRYVVTFHFLGQSTFFEQDGLLRGETYCIAHHLTSDEDPQDKVMYIRYHDTYAPDADGRLRIHRREVRPDWTGVTDANPRAKG
jgi:hypothetical protein